MVDHRRVAAGVTEALQDAIEFDYCRMVISVNDENEGVSFELRAHFEVCETCNGRGAVVNPSIDEQGLTQEDFDQDPDFREEYCQGRYDIPCPECKGRNVVLVPDEKNDPAALEAYQRIVEGAVDSVRERMHEREMGY